MRGAYAIARHEFLRRWPLALAGLGLAIVVRLFDTGTEVTQLANALASCACNSRIQQRTRLRPHGTARTGMKDRDAPAVSPAEGAGDSR